MARTAPMPMGAMAESCTGKMEKPVFGVLMAIPGIVLIAVGVLIIVWPSVLPWPVAAACILVGAAMLLMINFMRGVGARLRRPTS